jgi:SAM-dependent methyltransferase
MVVQTVDLGYPQPALEAYERLAPVYDVLTAGYDYETWLTELEELALRNGLSGRSVLDVGCGTGKSFEPLLSRGYSVTACDISPAMVEIARSKTGAAEVFVADMRQLPEVGPVDWVTCLDDAVNYLLDEYDLALALTGMRRVLRPGGLVTFDVNTLRTYRADFASEFWHDGAGAFICFRGSADPEFEPGGRAEALFESFVQVDDDCWRRITSRHEQRHHPRPVVEAACARAGLELVAVRGQVTGGHLREGPDELVHTKFVYMARRPRTG